MDDFITRNPSLLDEEEINETPGKDLSTLGTLGTVSSKLYVNNSGGHGYYEKMDEQVLTNFQQNVAPFITHLRVVELSLYPCFKEWTFLSSFVNLQHFEANHYGHGGAVNLGLPRATNDTRLDLEGTMLPDEWIKSLQVLKIGHNRAYPMNFNMQLRHGKILEKFQNLTHVSIPYLSFDTNSSTGFKQVGSIMSLEKFSVQFLALGVLASKQKLNLIDFCNLHEESNWGIVLLNRLAFDSIFMLFQTCLLSGTKLRNVNSEWFMFHSSEHPLFDTNHASLVVSMVNIHESACNLDFRMPNLETLDIRDTGSSCVDTFFEIMRPEWPALKTVKLRVNSTRSENNQDTAILYNFFWDDADWEQVTELSLSFARNMELPLPNTEDIVSSMPNLKVLQLANWIGSNADVTKFWIGLTRLQQVTLDSCERIGNEAFLGDTPAKPQFLNLRGNKYVQFCSLKQKKLILLNVFFAVGLKQLAFKGLDTMPGIDDIL